MGITLKEVMELLREKVNCSSWKDYDNGYEFSTILDFGGLKRELQSSIILEDFLDHHGIDMVFDNVGTHFIKL